MVPGAHITLSETSPVAFTLETTSAADGTFTLSGIPAGSFALTVAAPGFATEQTSGTATLNQIAQLSPITLHPGISSDVEVTLTRTEIAEDQIHDQEQQRVLGAIPNYYVSYLPHALPLTSKQKFELAWKTSIDPVSFGITAIISGFQQANDTFPGYNQGASGYAKRYGANYADLVSGTFIGGAILPSLLHQDPRYFYKGTGTIRHRIGYAIAMSVICKGDNGHWQPNYSGIIGSPRRSRHLERLLPRQRPQRRPASPSATPSSAPAVPPSRTSSRSSSFATSLPASLAGSPPTPQPPQPPPFPTPPPPPQTPLRPRSPSNPSFQSIGRRLSRTYLHLPERSRATPASRLRCRAKRRPTASRWRLLPRPPEEKQLHPEPLTQLQLPPTPTSILQNLSPHSQCSHALVTPRAAHSPL